MIFLENTSLDPNIVRFGVFLGLFVLLALCETLVPHRKADGIKSSRWMANLSLALIDGLFVRFLLPVAAIGAAYFAETYALGLFYWITIPIPEPLVIIICLVVLDAMMWFQHLISHKIPLLWRLHRVHHSDIDMDITTGVRFHPFEIGLSMLYKSAVIVLLGAPVFAVFLYEVLLNSMALFNHANLKLPEKVERILRQFIVTPDMHRIHHSVHPKETDSNYGNFLSIWDKLFNTYTHAPKDSQELMRIGLKQWRDSRPAQLIWLLINPFTKK